MTLDSGSQLRAGVYTGVWTDHSRGKVLGAVLTLDQRDSALLIAFLALFVAFVGNRLWRILCYALHYLFSSMKAQDALYHQRQAILRNSQTAASAVIHWARISVAWRHDSKRLIYRIGPLAVAATCIAIASSMAGVLSSRLASMTGQEVLVKSNFCGVNIYAAPVLKSNITVPGNKAHFSTYIPWQAKKFADWSNYALRCYSDNPDPQGCHNYVRPKLPYNMNRRAECPFQDEICVLNDGNIFLDSGYLNSHHDLGMNAPSNERFLYRNILHCAPLASKGRTKVVNQTVSGVNKQYVAYLYGSYTRYNEPLVSILYPKTSLKDMEFGEARSSHGDYTLSLLYAFVHDHTNIFGIFTPIEPLRRPDADVFLVFLSANDIIYPVAVDDPWYSAHQVDPSFHLTLQGAGNLTLSGHFADETVSTLGCVKQHQICLPDSHGNPLRCSSFGGQEELPTMLTSLQEDEKQHELTLWSMVAALLGPEADGFLLILGTSMLTSHVSVNAGIQGPMPDDQWQHDVEHWYAATLTALQGGPVDMAMGPSNPQMRSFMVPPQNAQEEYLCNNQKILSSSHANFTILGLVCIFGIGGVIVLVSIVLDPTIHLVQRRGKGQSYARLEWCTNGVLQIQRLAHEARGSGTWSRGTNFVPICRPNELLVGLDVGLPLHPVLSHGTIGDEGYSPTSPDSEEKIAKVLEYAVEADLEKSLQRSESVCKKQNAVGLKVWP